MLNNNQLTAIQLVAQGKTGKFTLLLTWSTPYLKKMIDFKLLYQSFSIVSYNLI